MSSLRRAVALTRLIHAERRLVRLLERQPSIVLRRHLLETRVLEIHIHEGRELQTDELPAIQMSLQRPSLNLTVLA